MTEDEERKVNEVFSDGAYRYAVDRPFCPYCGSRFFEVVCVLPVLFRPPTNGGPSSEPMWEAADLGTWCAGQAIRAQCPNGHGYEAELYRHALDCSDPCLDLLRGDRGAFS